jgi:hypothetical protein
MSANARQVRPDKDRHRPRRRCIPRYANSARANVGMRTGRAGPVEERFWEKVNRSNPDGCWPWTGARTPEGYGRFSVKAGHTVNASRYAYELTNGQLERRQLARHTCDNPPCCRPDHLIPGSYFDNEHDKISRGRDRKAVGERVQSARLTALMVMDIRIQHRVLGISQSELARRFGVTTGTISNIIRRVTWRHV